MQGSENEMQCVTMTQRRHSENMFKQKNWNPGGLFPLVQIIFFSAVKGHTTCGPGSDFKNQMNNVLRRRGVGMSVLLFHQNRAIITLTVAHRVSELNPLSTEIKKSYWAAKVPHLQCWQLGMAKSKESWVQIVLLQFDNYWIFAE